MDLTEKDREILKAIMGIGKSNISMKQIASNVGISYDQLRHRKSEMVSRNGFGTFLGFYHAFITEETEKE